MVSSVMLRIAEDVRLDMLVTLMLVRTGADTWHGQRYSEVLPSKPITHVGLGIFAPQLTPQLERTSPLALRVQVIQAALQTTNPTTTRRARRVVDHEEHVVRHQAALRPHVDREEVGGFASVWAAAKPVDRRRSGRSFILGRSLGRD